MEAAMIVVNKGKRSKRPRSLSPLLLPSNMAAAAEFGAGGGGAISEVSGVSDRALTPSSCNSGEITDEERDLEEDMANCLILLAKGQCQTPPPPPPAAASAEVYKCKTCSKSFPSFQALGGHRASHKKPNKPSALLEEKSPQLIEKIKSDGFRSVLDESTNLSLQISSRSSGSNSNSSSCQSNKSRVHECSICGAEFASGQALGGHMRRHRPIPAAPTTSHDQSRELKRPKSALSLDLNLPAPEDDRLESSKLPYTPKEQVIVFSASSLVDCHY